MTNSRAFELAEMLDNEEYPLHISKPLKQFAKDHNLVVVYGASDDLIEFDGAWYDEAGAYDGKTVFVNENGILEEPDCDCSYSEKHFNEEIGKSVGIDIFQGENDAYWSYKTIIPAARFKIMEDGDVNCIALVFAVSDLKGCLNG